MTSNPYDIVMLPAPELAQEAIALSEQLERYGTLFTLKDGAYFSHASLYMTQLRDADIDSVNARLSSIAAATPPPQLTAARYHQAEGYIDVDYERTQVLDRLQMAVV